VVGVAYVVVVVVDRGELYVDTVKEQGKSPASYNLLLDCESNLYISIHTYSIRSHDLVVMVTVMLCSTLALTT